MAAVLFGEQTVPVGELRATAHMNFSEARGNRMKKRTWISVSIIALLFVISMAIAVTVIDQTSGRIDR